MSYDLMVFEPTAAPRDRKSFDAWYDKVTQWGEGHDYDDPQFTSPSIRAWYRDMIETFPAMNGPDAITGDEADNPRVTDYCLAREAAYVGFRWSEAEPAHEAVVRLAKKHGLGFFDVSGNGKVYFPDDVHDAGEAKPGRPSFVARLFGWK